MLPIYLEITLVLLRRCLKVKKMPKIVAPHFSQDSYATQIFFSSYAYAANKSLWLYCCSLATLLVSGSLISRLPLVACSPPFHPFPKFCTPTQKNFVAPGKNASQTSLSCLCSKKFCKILDKAAEDLSNLKKSTKAAKSLIK